MGGYIPPCLCHLYSIFILTTKWSLLLILVTLRLVVSLSPASRKKDLGLWQATTARTSTSDEDSGLKLSRQELPVRNFVSAQRDRDRVTVTLSSRTRSGSSLLENRHYHRVPFSVLNTPFHTVRHDVSYAL